MTDQIQRKDPITTFCLAASWLLGCSAAPVPQPVAPTAGVDVVDRSEPGIDDSQSQEPDLPDLQADSWADLDHRSDGKDDEFGGIEEESAGESAGCLMPEGTQLCVSSLGAIPSGGGRVPVAFKSLDGGRIHVSMLHANGGGVWFDPTTGCHCPYLFPDRAPSGVLFGQFDTDAGVFTSVGVCPVSPLDFEVLIDELNAREEALKSRFRLAPWGLKVDPALKLELDGTVWHLGLTGGADKGLYKGILVRENDPGDPGSWDRFDMPVFPCLFSQEVLVNSGCYADPVTGATNVVPPNADSTMEVFLGDTELASRLSGHGHVPYTFFTRIAGEGTLAVRSVVEAVDRVSGMTRMIVALELPLLGVGSWSSTDYPAMRLVTVSHPGAVGGEYCWVRATVTEDSSRVRGTFEARSVYAAGGCESELATIRGAFDVGYTSCP